MTPIDSTTDKLLSLDEVARRFPKRNGRPVSLKTIRRWATRGYQGIRLQRVRIGSRLYVRESAIQAFVSACNPPDAEHGSVRPGPVSIAAHDPRKAAKIDRELAARGFYGEDARREVLGLPPRSKKQRVVQPGLPASDAGNQVGPSDGRRVDSHEADPSALCDDAE